MCTAADQQSRIMNGYTHPSGSIVQAPVRQIDPEVERIANHIQSIWATCKFSEIKILFRHSRARLTTIVFKLYFISFAITVHCREAE